MIEEGFQMKLVITMSRRYGTGASMIAQALSEKLDIPVYDKAFGFRMGADTVAEAVYGASEPEELPIAAIIDVDTEIYDGGVSFIMLRNLPSGAELIESGILFAYGEGDPEAQLSQ